jgi:hypothetical protein
MTIEKLSMYFFNQLFTYVEPKPLPVCGIFPVTSPREGVVGGVPAKSSTCGWR